MPPAHATEPCSRLSHWAGRTFLRLLGWRVEGAPPPVAKFVVLGAPHTSNWDLPIVLASSWALGIRIRWLAKKEMFVRGVAPLLHAMGGIPVDRAATHGLVGELAAAFEANDRMALMIPPDGTRGRQEAWKSGFYHVALAAKVPVVASYADFARKRSGICGAVQLTGDMASDMDAIRDLYAGVTPRHPAQATPIRLAAENNGSKDAR